MGKRRWVRVDKGSWTKVSASMASNNPFADLSTDEDVQLLRTEHVGGKDLHHIQMTGGLIIAPISFPPPT